MKKECFKSQLMHYLTMVDDEILKLQESIKVCEAEKVSRKIIDKLEAKLKVLQNEKKS